MESIIERICRQVREREQRIVANTDEYTKEEVALAKNAIYQRKRLSLAAILRYDD